MQYWAALQRGDPGAAWDIAMRIEYPIGQAASRARVGGNGFFQAMIEIYGVAPRWRRSPAANATEAEMDEMRGLLRRLDLL